MDPREKFDLEDGLIKGAVDNMTVVHRLNDGIDKDAGHQKHLATNYDVWIETENLLANLPVRCSFRHVKGHQDDMYKKGKAGPLTRDAFWNVQMDKKAGNARLTTPTDTMRLFRTLTVALINKGKPIYTKLAQTIRNAILDPPLRKYIQEKEQYDDDTFDAVDWVSLESSLKKVTVHKQINIAKYMFNWQNTGYQKQLFEEGEARTEDRAAQQVNLCHMGCGVAEMPQHYLQCSVLHTAKIITRDFAGVSRWMKKNNTYPELQIIIEKSLTQWMTSARESICI